MWSQPPPPYTEWQLGTHPFEIIFETQTTTNIKYKDGKGIEHIHAYHVVTIEKENKIERTSPASWAGKNMSKF